MKSPPPQPRQLSPEFSAVCGLDRKELRMKSHLVPVFLLACAAMAPTSGPAQERKPAKFRDSSHPDARRLSQYAVRFLFSASCGLEGLHDRHGKMERHCTGYAEVGKWTATADSQSQVEQGRSLAGHSHHDLHAQPMEDCGSRQLGGERRSHWARRTGQEQELCLRTAATLDRVCGRGRNDEVQNLMSQNPFQAPCGHKSAQPAKSP